MAIVPRLPKLVAVSEYAGVLTIYEIYASVQGESTHVGRPCVFVRLAACNLRCVWCDTPYAFTGGQKMAVEDVLARVDALGVPLVELTGGEPLLQKEAIPLMASFCSSGSPPVSSTSGQPSAATRASTSSTAIF